MAYIRKRNKRYHAYVTHTINGSKKTLASFNLGEIDKETATRCFNKVKKAEHLIKCGELNKDNWTNYFSFLNDNQKELEIKE